MTPDQERTILDKLDELVAESRLTRSAVQRSASRIADVEERVDRLENGRRSNGSSAPPGAE